MKPEIIIDDQNQISSGISVNHNCAPKDIRKSSNQEEFENRIQHQLRHKKNLFKIPSLVKNLKCQSLQTELQWEVQSHQPVKFH